MSFFRILFIFFLTIPLLEIYLFIQVGEVIGGLATIFIILATAIIGVWLLRWQGLMTLTKLQTTMAQGELPAVPMIEGMMLLVAGALLLTPGFFTDGVGFIFLVPALRQRLAQALLMRGLFRAGGGFGSSFQRSSGFPFGHHHGGEHTSSQTSSQQSPRHSEHQTRPQSGQSSDPRIIEGEYERRDD